MIFAGFRDGTLITAGVALAMLFPPLGVLVLFVAAVSVCESMKKIFAEDK